MIEKSKLLQAVLKQNVFQVQDAILDGEDMCWLDDHNRGYLHLAVHLKSYELVEFFLIEVLDPNQADADGATPLHRACRSGCENIVEVLLKYHARLNAKASDDITPVHVAAAYGHSRCLEVLLNYKNHLKPEKVDVDMRDVWKHTPLHYAANDGHFHAASTLIKHHCDVNAENLVRNRPLHFAAVSGNPKLCQLLIRSSAYIDAQNMKGQTALHLAILQGCAETVSFLLHADADPNIRDSEGETCAHLAIKHGDIELLKILMMSPRIDPSISDEEENTVLHVALKLGHFNLIPMMLPRARDLTRQDASGCSVLIEAIKNQLEDLALEMLNTCPSLAHTATIELVTPLHLAAERGMRNLTKQLLIAGAQVDATDANGLTPSLYCAKNDSVLECLAMIEDLMMVADLKINEGDEHKGNNSKMSSKISS